MQCKIAKPCSSGSVPDLQYIVFHLLGNITSAGEKNKQNMTENIDDYVIGHLQAGTEKYTLKNYKFNW